MNICMVVSNNVVNDVRVMKEARTLAEIGHKVSIFGISDKSEEIELDNIKIVNTANSIFNTCIGKIKPKKVTVSSAKNNVINNHKRSILNLFIKMKGIAIIILIRNNALEIQKSVLKSNEKFDVIHCHDLDTLIVGVNYKQNNNDVALVYDSHELWTEMSGINPIVKKYFIIQEAKLIHKVDHIITVSPSIVKELKKRYSIRQTPILLRNIPEVVNYESDKYSIIRDDIDKVKLIYVGFYLPGRGLEDIINEFPKIALNVQLYMRIKAEPMQLSALKSIIKERCLSERVFILPFVSQDDVLQEISKYDIGILSYLSTSLNNHLCLPNKLFQYMAGGVCVISNNLPDVSDILSHFECGETYQAEIKNSLSAIVNEIAENPSKLNKYKKNSIKAIYNELNWELEKQKLIALYKD